MSLSKGYLRCLTVMNFVYGIFVTASRLKIEDIDVSGLHVSEIDDEILLETITGYRDSLAERFLELSHSKEHAMYGMELKKKTKQMFFRVNPLLHSNKVDLDILAIRYFGNLTILTKKSIYLDIYLLYLLIYYYFLL